MTRSTIAILMPGDMGHAVGRALLHHGHDVITCLAGRSDHSKALAASAGLRDAGSLRGLVGEAGLILSILPPAAALDQAKKVAGAMRETGRTPVYADCNAISPMTAGKVADAISAAGASFIDAGIIGPPPGRGAGPRFYVSGADVSPMTALDGAGFRVIGLGGEVGKASAIKMAYAGLTKGTWTLQTAVLLAAEQLGVADALFEEFADSQKPALDAMRARIPFIPADSARWVGEMEEIAATFADVEVPSGFHDAAAEIFRLLATTPFSAETRQSMDRSRTLEEAIRVYRDHLPKRD